VPVRSESVQALAEARRAAQETIVHMCSRDLSVLRRDRRGLRAMPAARRGLEVSILRCEAGLDRPSPPAQRSYAQVLIGEVDTEGGPAA